MKRTETDKQHIVRNMMLLLLFVLLLQVIAIDPTEFTKTEKANIMRHTVHPMRKKGPFDAKQFLERREKIKRKLAREE